MAYVFLHDGRYAEPMCGIAEAGEGPAFRHFRPGHLAETVDVDHPGVQPPLLRCMDDPFGRFPGIAGAGEVIDDEVGIGGRPGVQTFFSKMFVLWLSGVKLNEVWHFAKSRIRRGSVFLGNPCALCVK